MSETFYRKFRVEELLLKEYDKWNLSLRPTQSTLGSMILSLKRSCPYVGELNSDETKELSVIFKQVETLLSNVFKNDKINYLGLMMVDNHVHFHVIPRYATPNKFEDMTFEDTGWPGLPDILFNNCDDQTLEKLHIYIRLKLDETYN